MEDLAPSTTNSIVVVMEFACVLIIATVSLLVYSPVGGATTNVKSEFTLLVASLIHNYLNLFIYG